MTRPLSDPSLLGGLIVVWGLLGLAVVLVIRAKGYVEAAMLAARQISLRQRLTDRASADDALALTGWIRSVVLDESGDRLVVRDSAAERLMARIDKG